VRFTPAGAVPARVSDFFESTKNRESRLFAACDDGEAALDIYRDALAGMKEYVENENIIDVKPYWKMKGIFVVEAELHLKKEWNGEKLNQFMSSISDTWLRFGDPADELLASVTAEGCTGMKRGVYMINIHFS